MSTYNVWKTCFQKEKAYLPTEISLLDDILTAGVAGSFGWGLCSRAQRSGAMKSGMGRGMMKKTPAESGDR